MITGLKCWQFFTVFQLLDEVQRYKDMQVSLKFFPEFISGSFEQKIYEIGHTDLVITSPDSKMEILLCHESDIHIEGTDDESITKLIAHFPEIDFKSKADWKKHYDQGT